MGDYNNPPAKTSNQTAPAPLLISKKWLCGHFGLMSAKGCCNYRALRTKVLTNEVLTLANLTADQVWQREVRQFDAHTSNRLKMILNLQ